MKGEKREKGEKVEATGTLSIIVRIIATSIAMSFSLRPLALPLLLPGLDVVVVTTTTIVIRITCFDVCCCSCVVCGCTQVNNNVRNQQETKT